MNQGFQHTLNDKIREEFGVSVNLNKIRII
jgi:hypothetical protein